MGPFREIRGCEVCGDARLRPVLDLGGQPLCDDLVPIGEDRASREYPVEILLCPTCLTAHQRFQVPREILFPPTYHYRARFTRDVLDGMRDLVGSYERRFGSVSGRRVLDVGCNDGSLLTIFRERGARTFGIEPTGAHAEAARAGHEVAHAFLSVELADRLAREAGPFDVVSFTNVFAHIERLPEVLEAVRLLCGPSTTLIVENHYLGSVLERSQFDTFYHEHPRTYSATSFSVIARGLGMAVAGLEFPKRYGGNIRVFAARGGPETDDLAAAVARERDLPERLASLAAGVSRWRTRKGELLRRLAADHGPLRAKAFPGRASILIRLLGLDTSTIGVVHEQPGSLKVGHYVPGTRIPIRSDEELFSAADPAKPILNLAWHIPGEIRAYLRDHGVRGEVIDVVSPDDLAAALPAAATGSG